MDTTGELRDELATRLEAEIGPLLGEPSGHGGYDCCGCSTYRQILDHAIRTVRGDDGP